MNEAIFELFPVLHQIVLLIINILIRYCCRLHLRKSVLEFSLKYWTGTQQENFTTGLGVGTQLREKAGIISD